ncbi:multidrug and toxin extrusion protein 1-like isoform X2 [Equus asinus]|uniref:multidrug and toxin extrusion protein 1-like isoform X2 n=1 Tax=Equus asinus TaxID=9793 RepID=UPI0038F707D6
MKRQTTQWEGVCKVLSQSESSAWYGISVLGAQFSALISEVLGPADGVSDQLHKLRVLRPPGEAGAGRCHTRHRSYQCHWCLGGIWLIFCLRHPYLPDIWEPELEARGGHPAEGRAGAPPLLLPLLGALPQHPADPAALQAGPGCVQATFLYALQVKYLLNQGIVLPQIVTGVAANLVNALTNYLFLHQLHLGVMGSALANTISQFTLALLLFLYIVGRKLHQATWGGWSLECLQDWASFFRLAIPSMLMLCIEWWAYEIGSFLSGILGMVELGAQSVVYELAIIVYMIPTGFSVAASVRVGNALGAGNIEQAKRSSAVALLITGLFAVIFCVLLLSCKDLVGYIFTTDGEIVALVAQVVPIYAVSHLFEGLACTSGGILRGSGNQKIGAIVNAIGYYVVGLPIGIALMFAARLGVVGLWLGIIICAVSQAVCFLGFVARLNWKKACQQAQVHANLKRKAPDGTSAFSQDLLDPVDPENHGGILMGDIEKKDETQLDQQMHQEECLQVHPRDTTKLSGRQLVLRRGLLLLGVVSVLLLGILVRVYVRIQ